MWLTSRSRSALTRILFPAASVLVVFLAFVIRVYHLGAPGMDGDEAFSIHAAYLGLSQILQMTTSVEPHPPFFYVFLRWWYLLTGPSEFALRYSSVVANVLAVVFLFKLARMVSGRALALVVMILYALSPFQVYYSQFVRMYAPAQLFGLVAIYFAVRALRQMSIRHLSAYVVFMLLALYTHYYAIFLCVFINLMLLAGLWRRRAPRSAMAHWVVSQLVIVVLYAPWPAAASRIALSYAPKTPGSTPLLGYLRESMTLYSVGTSLPADVRLPLELGFVAIGAAGLWLAARASGAQRRRLPFTVVSGYAFLPLALSLLVSLRRPMFEARYLMVSAPAFSLALGLGVVGLARWARPVGVAAGLFLVVTQSFSLGYYFLDNHDARNPMPDGIQYVLTHARPDDAVVLDGWDQPMQYWYYNTLRFNDRLPRYLFPANVPIPAEEAAALPHQLDEIMAQHQGVWLLDYSVDAYDPQHLVESYLSRNYYPSPVEVGSHRLEYYTSERTRQVHVTPLSVGFAGEVVLRSVNVGATSVEPGEILQLALSWQSLQTIQRDYVVSWRLVDRAGHVVYQRDAGPASGFAPSRDWTVGVDVVDRFGLPVPVFLPPGQYSVKILVYDRASGAVLEARQNDRPLPENAVSLAQIEIGKAPPFPALQDPSPSRPTRFAFGGLRLLGYDLSSGPFRAGQSVPVRLYWSASDEVGPREMVMRLLSERGQVLAERKTQLGTDWFPSDRWPRGRVIASYVDVPVPARTASGSYTLSFSLGDGGSGLSVFSDFPRIQVVSRERGFTVPTISHPRTAAFGGLVELLGYDLKPDVDQALGAGQTLQVTLYWRALREMDENFKVFTHLVGSDGRIYGQQDGTPLAGKAPTSSWVQGEVLADRYDIPIHPEAPPGSYQLLTGLYEPVKGARLPLSDGAGDSFVVTDVTVLSPGR